MNKLFIIGDGDDIRHHIESYLFDNDIKRLREFSANLIEAIGAIKGLAISKMDAEIVFAGGDDILFLTERNRYQRKYIEDLMNIFQKLTGTTISFGASQTIELAFINLRRAKAAGKGKVVEIGIE